MAHAITVRIEVPEGTSEAARADAERQARETAVLVLWERQELTIREAAEELNLTYGEFLDLLAARGIPIVHGSLDLQAIDDAERKLQGG